MRDDPVMQAALLQAERLAAGGASLGARASRPHAAAGWPDACP